MTAANPNTVEKLRGGPGGGNRYSETEVTTCAMAVYVHARKGSDENRYGSADKPFATLERAFERVPRIIDHDVLLVCLSDVTLTETFMNDHELRAGTLTIVGYGDPAAIVGPLTVDSVATLPVSGRQRVYYSAGGQE